MDQSLKVWPFWEGGIEQLTSPAFELKMSGCMVLLSFALGVHCTLHWVCNRQRSLPNSSCVCHLASWYYHQSKVFLDLARILEVAACTLLPHAPYFVPKNWVKKGEIGHTLGPMCIQGECIRRPDFSEHFRLEYLNMTRHQLHTKGKQCFLTDVKIWKSFEKTCCCVYQQMPTIRRRTLERFGMQVQQRWLNMRAGKHLKWVEQPASAYISTWTLGRVCI